MNATETQYKIADDEIDGVVEMMIIGSRYWSEYMGRNDDGARMVLVYGVSPDDENHGKTVTLDAAAVNEAFNKVVRLSLKYKDSDIYRAVRRVIDSPDTVDGLIDCGEVDSDLGDCMIQALLFDTIVYS